MIAALFAFALLADADAPPPPPPLEIPPVARRESGPRGPTTITSVQWLKKPTSADLNRLYPRAARKAGKSGRAVMSCQVLADGSLDGCSVVGEAPKGMGFGAAAVAMGPIFRMSPTVNGAPVGGGTVRIPMVFRHANGSLPPELTDLPPFTAPPPPPLEVPPAPPAMDYDAATWVRRPAREDVVRVYPAAALAQRQAGEARLSCRVERDGTVSNCRLMSEEPRQAGFGMAAMALGDSFAMPPLAPGEPPTFVDIRVRFEPPAGP